MSTSNDRSLLDAVSRSTESTRGYRFGCGKLLLGIVKQEVLRILVQECVVKIDHLELLDVISRRDLL